MVTSAQFQMLSAWPSAISVNLTGENLNGDFPTPLPASPAYPSPTNPVGLSASDSPGQSWIGLKFKSSSLGINLGRGIYEAGIRYLEGPAGQATAIIAPRDPGDIHGWDFFIWVLAGPGKLQTTLNSIINANKDAMISFVKEQMPQINTTNFSLQFTNLTADTIGCTFATISKQGKKSPWNVDIVLSYSGTISVQGKALGIGFSSNVKFKNLVAQMGLTIDTTKSSEKDPRAPELQVTRLQCSVEDISGLPFGSPGSYYAPGFLNTTYNSEVLNALNEKLKDFAPKLGSFKPLEKYNLAKIPKTPSSPGNFQEWMSRPSIQAKRLGQLKIPGTHDSAAYYFDGKISHILYDATNMLAKLRNTTAPPDHKLNDLSTIYIGPEAYQSLVDHIALIGQAHHESKTIKKQLEDGIRYFDLRIYKDKDDNEYYTQHTLRASKLKDLIAQIHEFVVQHESSQEFIILEFAQSWFTEGDVSEDTEKVANLLTQVLGRWLYMPPDAPSNPGPDMVRYDFQNLGSKQLSDITSGKPKLLFVSRDACIYPHSVLNVDDASLQSPQPGSALYPWWFTTTPSSEDAVGSILMNAFDPSARYKSLQHFSYENNANVANVLKQDPPVWRYMMDWYTESKSGVPPVDLIIKAND